VDWVFAVERAYVNIATAHAPSIKLQLRDETPARLAAASGAVASRFLAVGTPRSFSLIVDEPGLPRRGSAAEGQRGVDDEPGLPRRGSAAEGQRGVDDESQHELALLSLEAHATWFSPKDIRCTSAALGHRLVSVAEALAADIVCVHGSKIQIAASALRRGTHLNILGGDCVDPELVATIVTASELPAMAAGFVDGRQLDELTVFRYQA
jgi:hypothetical protein